jgi:hypothetical protein
MIDFGNYSPKISGRVSFMQDDELNNPYNFLRDEIPSIDPMKYENLEDSQLHSYKDPHNDEIEQIEPSSDHKKLEEMPKSAKKTTIFDSSGKQKEPIEEQHMYPHYSLNFEKDSDMNSENDSPEPHIRTPVNLESSHNFLEKKQPSELEESQDKMMLDDNLENRYTLL